MTTPLTTYALDDYIVIKANGTQEIGRVVSTPEQPLTIQLQDGSQKILSSDETRQSRLASKGQETWEARFSFEKLRYLEEYRKDKGPLLSQYLKETDEARTEDEIVSLFQRIFTDTSEEITQLREYLDWPFKKRLYIKVTRSKGVGTSPRDAAPPKIIKYAYATTGGSWKALPGNPDPLVVRFHELVQRVKLWSSAWGAMTKQLQAILDDVAKRINGNESTAFRQQIGKKAGELLLAVSKPAAEVPSDFLKTLVCAADIDSEQFKKLAEVAWKVVKPSSANELEQTFTDESLNLPSRAPRWTVRTLMAYIGRQGTQREIQMSEASVRTFIRLIASPQSQQIMDATQIYVQHGLKNDPQRLITSLQSIFESEAVTSDFVQVFSKLKLEQVQMLETFSSLLTQSAKPLWDDWFQRLLKEHSAPWQKYYLEMFVHPQLGKEKRILLANHVHSKIKTGSAPEGARAVALLAFSDEAVGDSVDRKGELATTWRSLLKNRPIPGLQQYLDIDRDEVVAPLKDELVAARTETARYVAETQRQSKMLRELSDQIGERLAWGRSVIEIIDGLDNNGEENVARKLVLLLRSHGIDEIEYGLGVIINRKDRDDKRQQYRLIEDPSGTTSYKVVQRGFVYRDLTGDIETLRPALLEPK